MLTQMNGTWVKTNCELGCCGKEEHLHVCVVDTAVKYDIGDGLYSTN